MLIKSAKKIQQAIPSMAEVAVWRQRTENRMESASQKQMYTPVKSRKTKIRPTSSALGGIPITRSPTAPMISPMENTMTKIIVAAARNFPLITESLYTGWETR